MKSRVTYHRWCYVTIEYIYYSIITFYNVEFWLVSFFQYREELRRLRSGTTVSSIPDNKGEKKSVHDDNEEVAHEPSEEDEVRVHHLLLLNFATMN